MANPYYGVGGVPATQARGASATIRSEFTAVQTGFDAVQTAIAAIAGAGTTGTQLVLTATSGTTPVKTIRSTTAGNLEFVNSAGTGVLVSITDAGQVTFSGSLIGNLTGNVSGSAASITGINPVANGGTGVATLAGIPYGNGTAAVSSATANQIVSAIGVTAVANATTASNALALNGQPASYYQTAGGTFTGAVNGTSGLFSGVVGMTSAAYVGTPRGEGDVFSISNSGQTTMRWYQGGTAEWAFGMAAGDSSMKLYSGANLATTRFIFAGDGTFTASAGLAGTTGTFSGALTASQGVFNATTGTALYVSTDTTLKITQRNAAGTVQGYIGADATRPFFVINAANSQYSLSTDNSGNFTTAGSITASAGLAGTTGTFSGALTASQGVFNATTGTALYVSTDTTLKITQRNAAGTVQGYIGADATRPFFVINAANTQYSLSTDNSGNFTTAGSITASAGVAGTTGTFTSNVSISGANSPLILNSTNSAAIKATLQDAGTVRGYIGANAAQSFIAFNASVSPTLTVDQSGNGTFTGGVNATSAVSSGDVQSASQNGGQLAGMRNRIINGDMRIDQRNNYNSATLPQNSYTYFADRWQVAVNGAATVAQVAFVGNSGTNNPYGLTIYGGTSVINPQFMQKIEAKNSYDLAGKTVAVSFWMYQNSGSAQTVNCSFGRANSTDNFSAVTSDGGAALISSSLPNVVWTKFTGTATLSTSANTGIYVIISYSGNIPASTACILQSVQLELGSVATPFEQRPISYELAACQRYCLYEPFFQVPPVTSGVSAQYPFKTTMRTIPTATFTTNNSTPSTGSASASNTVIGASGGTTTVASNCTGLFVAEL